MRDAPIKELAFVYNANSGIFNKVTDFAHKLISPDTYACSLCSLTHGGVKIHQQWADFIRGINYRTTFVYKDQIDKQLIDSPLPLVLQKEGNQTRIILSAAELNAMRSLDELIETLKTKL